MIIKMRISKYEDIQLYIDYVIWGTLVAKDLRVVGTS